MSGQVCLLQFCALAVVPLLLLHKPDPFQDQSGAQRLHQVALCSFAPCLLRPLCFCTKNPPFSARQSADFALCSLGPFLPNACLFAQDSPLQCTVIRSLCPVDLSRLPAACLFLLYRTAPFWRTTAGIMLPSVLLSKLDWHTVLRNLPWMPCGSQLVEAVTAALIQHQSKQRLIQH